MTERVPAAVAADTLKCDLACEVLRSFGSLRFAATGWSMIPTLWPGDTLVIERVSSDRIQIGDIALVRRHSRLCAHRIVARPDGRGHRQWITRGDAMPGPDRPLTESQLLGRVASVIRDGKLTTVPPQLNVIDGLVAKIVRRSFFVARVLIYLRRTLQAREEAVL